MYMDILNRYKELKKKMAKDLKYEHTLEDIDFVIAMHSLLISEICSDRNKNIKEINERLKNIENMLKEVINATKKGKK